MLSSKIKGFLTLALTTSLWAPLSAFSFTPTDPLMSDYYKVPPYTSTSEQPSTLILLDSSGSMREPAYFDYSSSSIKTKIRVSGSCQTVYDSFDPTAEYYGYFDTSSYYTLDTTNDYFVKCSGDASSTCDETNAPWSGNLLNYMFMLRMDVSKKVLTGGKVESSDPTLLMFYPSTNYYTRVMYDDSSAVTDLNGNTRHLSPFQSAFVAVRSTSGSYNRVVFSALTSGGSCSGGFQTSGSSITTNKLRVQIHADDLVDGTAQGLIQKNYEKMRFGVAIFDTSSNQGADVQMPVGSDEEDIVDSINAANATSSTPLAESLYTIAGYYQQEASIDSSNGPRYATNAYYLSEDTNHNMVLDSGEDSDGDGVLDTLWDPFCFGEEKGYVSCSKAFVIAITDGEPTSDGSITSSVRNAASGLDASIQDTSSFIDDVAYWAHTTDLRPDLEGDQSIDLYGVFLFGSGSSLRKGTIVGSFEDKNNDGVPNSETVEAAASSEYKEWDQDGDGEPDNYAEANNGQQLEDAITNAINSILSDVSSGSASAVSSSSREGDGTSYQTIFAPSYTDDSAHEVTWFGELYALFKDSNSNLREDTNGDGILEYDDDRIVVMFYDETSATSSTRAYLYKDTDGDGKLDTGEDEDGDGKCDTEDEDVNLNDTLDLIDDLNANGVQDSGEIDLNGDGNFDTVYEDLNSNCILDAGEDLDGDGVLDVGEDLDCDGNLDVNEDADDDGNCDLGETTTPDTTVDLMDIKFLWSAGKELGKLTDSNVEIQPGTYSLTSALDSRYIMTAFDDDGDGIIEPGEAKSFSYNTGDSPIGQVSNIYTYFHLPLEDPTSDSDYEKKYDYDDDDDTTNDSDDLELLINYIRGVDNDAFRARTIMFDENQDDTDDTTYTWRLGDIVSSAPLSVQDPEENLDEVYGDDSYRVFAKKYLKRRHVLYAGGNDGMLHAFNGGFYRSADKTLYRSYDISTKTYGNTGPELGQELWAYVPYNLLPHLQWLGRTDYQHVYFVDKEVRVADVKIFEPESACSSDAYDENCIHPNGWGTILIGGMGFGGGPISVDSDADGDLDSNDEVLSSGWFVFDITNPETKPVLLGEFSYDVLDGTYDDSYSFTLSDPTIIEMKNSANTDTGIDWYVVFGTGPNTLDGESSLTGKVYVMKLNYNPATNGLGQWIVDDGAGTDKWFGELAEEHSFVSDLISTDFETGTATNAYKDDVVYFGSVSGGFDESDGTDYDGDGDTDSTGWSGALYRIILDNNTDPTTWIFGTTSTEGEPFLNIGKPITTAPNVAVDDDDNIWVYAGTGRYYSTIDAADDSGQYLIGVMEPINSSGDRTYEAVDTSNLFDVTNVQVYEGSSASSLTVQLDPTSDALISFNALKAMFDNDPATTKYRGWMKEVIQDTKERVLNDTEVYGGAVIAASYAPSEEVCDSDGESWAYALYYTTGTAYYDAIIGTDTTVTSATSGTALSLDVVSLGDGFASGPVIDDNPESDTSSAIFQGGNGQIISLDIETPNKTDDSRLYWMEDF